MKRPAGTVVAIIGGLMAAATVTPVVMGIGVLAPSMIAIFLLGLVLLYTGARMRSGDDAEQPFSRERDASGDATDADVNRDPAGTPTTPGVEEQDEIKGL